MNCRSRSVASRRNGVSLIEVLLATAVMAAGMVALMHHSHQTSQTVLRASLEAEAATRCESALTFAIANQGPNLNQELENRFSDQQWRIKLASGFGDSGQSTASPNTVSIQATFLPRPELCQFELCVALPQASP